MSEPNSVPSGGPDPFDPVDLESGWLTDYNRATNWDLERERWRSRNGTRPSRSSHSRRYPTA